MVKTWTTLQPCALHINALLLVQSQCTPSLLLAGLSFSYRLSSTNLCCSSSRSKTPWGLWIMFWLIMLRPGRVWLRRIHAGGIWLPFAWTGCGSSTLTNSTQYDFSWTNMFTCILKVWFCQTTTINQFSFTSCKHTDRKSTSSHLEAKFLFISLSHLLCHMSEVEVGTWRQKPQQRITKTWRKDQCHKCAVGRYSLVSCLCKYSKSTHN